MKESNLFLTNANKAIENSLASGIDRGEISINILAQLRNLIEAIFVVVYEADNSIKIEYDYKNIEEAKRYIYSKSKFKLLYKFHSFLKISTSHYTLDSNNSERLMVKYYEYLIEIKEFTAEYLGIIICNNIDLFPINQDKTFEEYYFKISDKIKKYKNQNFYDGFEDRFYVEKVKPFFVGGRVFYEITLSPGNDVKSKFDRIIVFSKFKIARNYAIKASFTDSSITVLGLDIPIKIVSNWMVSIRPCEINNFAKYFNIKLEFKTETKEFYETMKFLTEKQLNLYDIAITSEQEYKEIYNYLHKSKRISEKLFQVIFECRKIINNNKNGSNILRYLLYIMKNNIIKKQYSGISNAKVSNLLIEYGSISFDEMPYCSSLLNHNPRLTDLFECIPTDNRIHELLARKVKNNTEKEAILYTNLDDLVDFENIPKLVSEYNDRIFRGHTGRKLIIDKNQIFISDYEEKTIKILNKIISLSHSGIEQYTTSVESWVKDYNNIDDPEKNKIIKTIFQNSKVAAIYGSAGTGKTTLINHIANLFKDSKKLFLANTNTAVDNLRKKVSTSNCSFCTVAKNSRNRVSTDILIIDESSTVNNSEMLDVLMYNQFELLIIVGDIFQIESISFGNWFGLIKKFIPNCCFELYKPYRTTDNNLLNLWELVRKNDETISEQLSKNLYSNNLDESIFDYKTKDEIILCLNYDGLYGINNINRLLQIKNKNKTFEWGIWTYKVGDPIVFNESDRFPNTIYNNLKGIIKSIIIEIDKIYFEIEIDRAINAFNLDRGLKLINTNEGKSIIGFTVSKVLNTDSDDSSFESVVPFQIAYAISIHKAQGLEYDIVKLIINSEIEENISHNIFYTAITRARKSLKIYWSPETQQNVTCSFKLKDVNKDFGIVKAKINSLNNEEKS